MNVEGQDGFASAQPGDGAEPSGSAAGAAAQPSELSLADRWIRSRLAAMLERVESGFAEYRLDIVANALYEFTWNEFCDWYLELSKAVLQSDTAAAAQKRGTRKTLIGTLEMLLRALHPLAPFISEEIWQRVRFGRGRGRRDHHAGSHSRARMSCSADAAAEPEMRWVMDFIQGVRQIRGEMDIAPSRKLEVLLQNAGPRDLEYLGRNRHYLSRLAGIADLACWRRPRPRRFPPSPWWEARDIGAHGGPDRPDGRARALGEAADGGRKPSSSKMEGKLANAEFARNAPPEVVAKDQAAARGAAHGNRSIGAQIARVNALEAQ